MNLFLIAVVLLLIPTVCQIVFGNLSTRQKIIFPFALVCLACVLLQFVAIFCALQLVLTDMNQKGIRCGLPSAAMFFLGLVVSFVLLLTIICQLVWRKFRKP